MPKVVWHGIFLFNKMCKEKKTILPIDIEIVQYELFESNAQAHVHSYSVHYYTVKCASTTNRDQSALNPKITY